MTKITDEIKDLFRKVRIALGAPVRKVELTDESLCGLLEMCIEDYAEKVQNWMITNQWVSLYGKNVSTTDMAFALSVRTFDMMKDYSYWFSKEVGLQQEGTKWELKKDFITIEKGKQVYVIPAGRTINKVMYVNPPVTQAALFAQYGGFIDTGFGGGFSQVGGAGFGAMGGFYMAPAADVAYLATDMTYKNRLIRSDLVYNVTAGPNGTHLLHLLSTPGSKLNFGFAGGGVAGLGLVGCEVWYTYYDTTSDNEDDCLRDNVKDIILTPDQVPLSKLDYFFLNDPTKTLIRQLLVAKAKQNLALIRGKYSGKVNIPQAEMMMDYAMLAQQGDKEWDAVMKSLEDRLQKMSPEAMLETQNKIAQQTRELQGNTPLGIYVI